VEQIEAHAPHKGGHEQLLPQAKGASREWHQFYIWQLGEGSQIVALHVGTGVDDEQQGMPRLKLS
jgi:Co/Zn/Cd efflux system component